jgi:hypothetical protein
MRKAGRATNLDRLRYYPLETLIWGVQLHPRRYARKLFPHRPKHYVRATMLLALYAIELLEARSHRNQGHIQSARTGRQRCNAIYEQLPECARWRAPRRRRHHTVQE